MNKPKKALLILATLAVILAAGGVVLLAWRLPAEVAVGAFGENKGGICHADLSFYGSHGGCRG